MFVVAGTTRVQSTVPERSNKAHRGFGGILTLIETEVGCTETSIAIPFNCMPAVGFLGRLDPNFVDV